MALYRIIIQYIASHSISQLSFFPICSFSHSFLHLYSLLFLFPVSPHLSSFSPLTCFLCTLFCKKAQLFNIHNKILPDLSLTSLACFKCPDIRLADEHSTGISVIRFQVSYNTCLSSIMQIIWGKNINMLADRRVKG